MSHQGSQWFVLYRDSHLNVTVEEHNLQIKNPETQELSWQARNRHKLGLGNWLLSDYKLPENRDYVLISVLALALRVYLGSYQEPGYVLYKCWAPHSIPHDSPQLCSCEIAYAEGSRLFPGNLRPRDISCFQRWGYPARIFLKPFCCLISDPHNFWQSTCVNIRITSSCWWPGFCPMCFWWQNSQSCCSSFALLSWARLSVPCSTSCEVSINSKYSYCQTMTYHFFNILRGK